MNKKISHAITILLALVGIFLTFFLIMQLKQTLKLPYIPVLCSILLLFFVLMEILCSKQLVRMEAQASKKEKVKLIFIKIVGVVALSAASFLVLIMPYQGQIDTNFSTSFLYIIFSFFKSILQKKLGFSSRLMRKHKIIYIYNIIFHIIQSSTTLIILIISIVKSQSSPAESTITILLYLIHISIEFVDAKKVNPRKKLVEFHQIKRLENKIISLPDCEIKSEYMLSTQNLKIPQIKLGIEPTPSHSNMPNNIKNFSSSVDDVRKSKRNSNEHAMLSPINQLGSFSIKDIDFSTFHKISADTPSKKKSKLWRFLPSILNEPLAVFKYGELYHWNDAFENFIKNNFEGAIEGNRPFSTLLPDVFEKMNVILSSALEEENRNIKYNLLDEFKNILDYPLSISSDQEIAADYLYYKEKKKEHEIDSQRGCLGIKIVKQSFESKHLFTIIRFTDLSNHSERIVLDSSTNFQSFLISSLSHEIKTPFNQLLTCMRNLRFNNSESNIETAFGSLKIFLLVFQGILNLGLAQNPKKEFFGNPSKFCVSKTAMNLFKIMKPHFENRGIDFFFDDKIPERRKSIYQEKDFTKMVIYQLLSNALKFTKRGKVDLILDYNPLTSEIIISVKDTGVGMDSVTQKNLTLFLEGVEINDQKISPNSTGINLGFKICKALLYLMHPNFIDKKRITFVSEVNVGSTFTVRFSGDYSKNQSDINPRHTERSFSLVSRGSTNPWNPVRTNSRKNEDSIDEKHRSCQELIKEKKDCLLQEEKLELNYEENISPDPTESIPEYYKAKNYVFEPKVPSFALEFKKNHDAGPTQDNFKDSRQKIKIFIADDEEFNLTSFKMIAQTVFKKKQKEFELILARDGQEAIEKLIGCFEESEKSESPSAKSPIDLIILDYNMPGLNGAEVAKKFSEYLSLNNIQGVPMFGWTAYVGQEYKKNFLNAGCAGLMDKPLRIKNLVSILSEHELLQNINNIKNQIINVQQITMVKKK